MWRLSAIKVQLELYSDIFYKMLPVCVFHVFIFGQLL